MARQYPNLKTLILSTHFRHAAALVGLNPTLSAIEVYISGPSNCPRIWEPATSFKNLRHLIVYGDFVGFWERDHFWKVCSELDSLVMAGNSNLPISSMSETIPKVQNLTLLGSPALTVQDELGWIAHFPHLKRLQWHAYADAGLDNTIPMEEFAAYAAIGTWPELEVLILAPYQPLSAERGLANSIRNLKRLISLRLAKMAFGPLSLEALRIHFGSLRVFNIQNCTLMTGDMVQTILASCPQLEEFQAHQISSKDIYDDGRPWVCSSLRILRLEFRITGTRGQIRRRSQQIFTRLSEFYKLRELTLSTSEDTDPKAHPLLFRQTRGLARLVTLTDLRKVRFAHNINEMDTEDLQWMVDHWPRLERIRGLEGEIKTVWQKVMNMKLVRS
ncbi:hypothetical protein BGX28_007735 [Mortierella sp. GBA30]|nr:hypothetical protein BGX28_007735 [Mortierella sp. GBA30]